MGYQFTHAVMPFPLIDESGRVVKPAQVERSLARALVEISFQLRHNLIVKNGTATDI